MKYNFTYSLMTSKYGFLPYKGTRLSCIGNFYLLQAKFAKVVFLHLSVSHSVHRGVSRPIPKARSTPGGVSQHALRQTSPPGWLLLQVVRILLEYIILHFTLAP